MKDRPTTACSRRGAARLSERAFRVWGFLSQPWFQADDRAVRLMRTLGASQKSLMPFPTKFSSFEYQILPSKFGQTILDIHSDRMLQRYALQTKNWSEKRNAEWLVRFYLAIKMIMSATVLLNSLKYASKKNLKIVEPYLIYYSLLSCCRALIFTLPDIPWNDGELATATHSKAINLCVDAIQIMDKKIGEEVRRIMNLARSLREMYSYRFPARGLKVVPEQYRVDTDKTIEICALLCEVAQLNSELLETSVMKNVSGNYETDEDIFKTCFEYQVEDGKAVDIIFDEDDWYRLGRMAIKEKVPFSLRSSMSEGMTEDFFYAWAPDDENMKDVFDISNPGREWEIIFPIP